MKNLWTILLAVLLVTGLTFIGCGEVPPPPDEPVLFWSLEGWFKDTYDADKSPGANTNASPFEAGGSITGSDVTYDAEKHSITIPGSRTNNYDQFNLRLDGANSISLAASNGPRYIRWAGTAVGTDLVARLQNSTSYEAYEKVDIEADGKFEVWATIEASANKVNLSITDEGDAFVGGYSFDVLEVWIGGDPRIVVIED